MQTMQVTVYTEHLLTQSLPRGQCGTYWVVPQDEQTLKDQTLVSQDKVEFYMDDIKTKPSDFVIQNIRFFQRKYSLNDYQIFTIFKWCLYHAPITISVFIPLQEEEVKEKIGTFLRDMICQCTIISQPELQSRIVKEAQAISDKVLPSVSICLCSEAQARVCSQRGRRVVRMMCGVFSHYHFSNGTYEEDDLMSTLTSCVKSHETITRKPSKTSNGYL